MSRINHRVPTGPHLRVAREVLLCDDCRGHIHAGHRYVRDDGDDFHVGCWEDDVEELEVFEELEEVREWRRDEALEDFVEDLFDW